MAKQYVLQLPPELTVASVQGLRHQFEQLLRNSDLTAIRFDATEVRRADTAGLQLLHAFVRAADERNLEWGLTDAPAVLIRSAKLLGLDTALAIAA